MRTNYSINPTDEMLLEAVLDGNKDQVELIVKKYNGNVNAQDKYGASPALLAAKRNDLEMLKYLVDNGADLNVSDGLNQTVMHWAKHNKNDDMVEYLENHGFTLSFR